MLKMLPRCCRGILKALKSPKVWMMMLLYCITFAIILPVICVNLKHSLYYINTKAKTVAQEEMKKQNDERIHHAEIFFTMLEKGKFHQFFNPSLSGKKNKIDIAISVISVSRNKKRIDQYEPRYLTQVVWKFLSLLHRETENEQYSMNIQLSICNVDSDPKFYTEARNMSKYVPVFDRFSTRTLNMDHILEKEKQDYVFCLNKSRELYHPKFVLLVEDDALPHDDFFVILQYIIQQHLGHKEAHGLEMLNNKPLLFVKMYHPERLLSFYSLEPERLAELFAMACLFGTVCLPFYFYIAGPYKSTKELYLIWMGLITYFLLLATAIGRSNFVELRRVSKYLYSYVPAPGCCTPAMLFPEYGAEVVIDYLSKIKCKNRFGKDMALDQLRQEKRVSAYMIQPNLFTHIGMYSSLRDAILDPHIV